MFAANIVVYSVQNATWQGKIVTAGLMLAAITVIFLVLRRN